MISTFSGHRMRCEPGQDDRCLDCGWDGTGRIEVCRPDVPRCGVQGCALPSATYEVIGGEIFHYCAPHRSEVRAC